jgi:hypothetical protein
MSDSDDVDSLGSEEVVVKPKRKKRKKNKDPNRPKRNRSAFFLYSNANRARVKADNPDAKFGDIVSRHIAEFCVFCVDTRTAFGGHRVHHRVEYGAASVDGLWCTRYLYCEGRLRDPLRDVGGSSSTVPGEAVDHATASCCLQWLLYRPYRQQPLLTCTMLCQ